MILSFHPCFLGDTQVILGDGTLDSHDLGHIRGAEVIILPQNCPLELYQACKNSSAKIFPNYDARFEYPGKMGQSILFRTLKCPHPETRRWSSVEEYQRAYPEAKDFPHATPFVIKGNESHEAEALFFITDEEALKSSLEDLTHLEKSGSKGFVSQEFISTEGSVLRSVIMGRKFITYWKRVTNPDQIMSTISLGSKIDKDWRTDLQKKGRIQAQEFSAVTGINLAAIDFVFSFSRPDPQPLFLEVNYYFGRRGLGGSLNYYRLLHEALQEWLSEQGFDPNAVNLL